MRGSGGYIILITTPPAFCRTATKTHTGGMRRTRFLVFGYPNDGLRVLLDAYEASYHRPFGSFPYWG